MKSKIEKVRLCESVEENKDYDGWKCAERAMTRRELMAKLNEVIEIQWEIIDYLNSQSEESKTIIESWAEKHPSPYLTPNKLKIGNKTEEKEEVEYPIHEAIFGKWFKDLPDGVPEDTPEEWEDRFSDLLLKYTDKDIEERELTIYVKQLLEEREREAYKRGREDGVMNVLDGKTKVVFKNGYVYTGCIKKEKFGINFKQ